MFRIDGRNLRGEVSAPPSKSMSHRAILCGALAEGESILKNVSDAKDIFDTIEGVKALGAQVTVLDQKKGRLQLSVCGRINRMKKSFEMDASATTLRLILPLFLCAHSEVKIYVGQQLLNRPMEVYERLFAEKKIYFQKQKDHIAARGALRSGDYEVRGDISSQFISGLLLALPLLEGDSTLTITNGLESKGYVDMTCHMMKQFGVKVSKTKEGYHIGGGQKYKPRDIEVEADFSQGAFWLSLMALGKPLKLWGLPEKSLQPDRKMMNILAKMGAQFESEAGKLGCIQKATHNVYVSADQCPDLVPVVAMVMGFLEGRGRITGAKRLRFKESDRLFAMQENLKNLGIEATEKKDALLIEGKGHSKGGGLLSFSDHRIIMAAAIAACFCEGEVYLDDIRGVDKSYPAFWDEFQRLGGTIDEIKF